MSSLSQAGQVALVTVFVVASSVWVGGSAVIVVVVRAARRTLAPAERVELFRALGRGYGIVGGIALALALGTGAVLVSDHPWDGPLIATAVVAGSLVIATAVGVVQARRMTRLRRAALQQPQDGAVRDGMAGAVRRGARTAAVLRTAIAVLTLALVVLGALLVTA